VFQSARESLDLSFGLADLGVQFIPLPLQLLPFLCRLDNLVDLRLLLPVVLLVTLPALGQLVLLAERLLLDLEVLNVAQAFTLLLLDLVDFVLYTFGLSHKDVLVHFHLTLSFFSGQHELSLPVLQGLDSVHLPVQLLLDAPQLHLEQVRLHQQLLTFLEALVQVLGCQIDVEVDLVDGHLLTLDVLLDRAD